MKVLPARVLFLTVCATAALGGCSSSSDNSPEQAAFEDPTSEDADSGTDVDGDSESDSQTDTGEETESEGDTETDTSTDNQTVTDTDTVTDNQIDSDTNTVTDNQIDTSVDTNTDDQVDTDTDTDTQTESESSGDSESDSEPVADIFVPGVTAGSDLDRLLKGIKRQVSLTLLDLNSSLSEGVLLTNQQEVCLGSYDPAEGEQLLAINCDQELATGDVSVYVKEAAFYDLDDCHASIFNGNTDNCQLQRADIRLPDVWIYPEGERRPVVQFAGSRVTYAVTGTMLEITSTEPALSGLFSCSYDLATSTATSASASGAASCAQIVTTRADHLDEVVPQ